MRRGWQWPAGMAVILLLTVAANLYLLYAAGHDASFAIEPDYYRKAVDWDAHLAQEEHNRELGWSLHPRIGPLSREGDADLEIGLADRQGRPVSGASLHVTAIPVARASQPVEATLAESPDHRYAGRLSLRRVGLWELRVTAIREGDRFTRTVRLDAGEAAASP